MVVPSLSLSLSLSSEWRKNRLRQKLEITFQKFPPEMLNPRLSVGYKGRGAELLRRKGRERQIGKLLFFENFFSELNEYAFLF